MPEEYNLAASRRMRIWSSVPCRKFCEKAANPEGSRATSSFAVSNKRSVGMNGTKAFAATTRTAQDGQEDREIIWGTKQDSRLDELKKEDTMSQ